MCNQQIMSVFLNHESKLRNTWWIAIFFLVLALFTFPVIFLSQYYKWEITTGYQAIIIVATTWVCQLLRRQPLSEITGRINNAWFKYFFIGLLLGAILMLVPALFLLAGRWVKWQVVHVNFSSLLNVTGLFIAVAIAEEFLFRGFIFQRLISGIGIWAAQLIMAAYFLLIHFNNPGMSGSIKVIATINIFLASILFGLAFIKTKNLATPLALHFMANWIQGTLLGFGVSGSETASFLKPVFAPAPLWLTGGTFGLEASIPGLIMVIVITLVLYRWKPRSSA